MTVSSIFIDCINEVMNTRVDETPKVGMPATIFVGSDRYAMIVLEVLSPKRAIITHMQDDDYDEYEKNPEAFDGEAVIEKYKSIEPQCKGMEYTLRKNGRWLPKGSGLWDTSSARFGAAENYMDPCF